MQFDELDVFVVGARMRFDCGAIFGVIPLTTSGRDTRDV